MQPDSNRALPTILASLLPPPAIGLAVAVGLFFPLFLLICRIVPGLSANPSGRYLAACILAIAAWVALLAAAIGGAAGAWPPVPDIVNGALVLLAAFVVYLGLWGLLTRGCSISLLLALRSLGTDADTSSLGAAYSGGRGLRWLGDKRINSLSRAGFVVRHGDMVEVTDPVGTLAARLCVLLVKVMGLRSFG